MTPTRDLPLLSFAMAETTSINLTALQAVVTWVGTDGQTNILYRQDSDPSLQVTLNINFDDVQEQSGCTGLFRLHVPVDLKASPHEKTPLLLYIRPERVVSLMCEQGDEPELPGSQVDDVDALVRTKLGPQPVCLKFGLTSPADMVVPTGVPLVPTKRKPHGERLHLLTFLAQITSFSIFLKAQDIGSLSLLQELSGAIADPARCVKSNAQADSIASLYSGRGGKILDGAEVSANGPRALPPSPPSYADVGVPPPMAPLDRDQGKRTIPIVGVIHSHIAPLSDMLTLFEYFQC